MRLRRVLRRVGAAFLIAGCVSPFVDTWQDPGWKGPPLRNVLVVGNAQSEVGRRAYEDAMSARLAEIGVRAEPSYRIVPGDQLEREAIARAVAAGGHDGLIAARLVGVDQRATYVPGSPGPVAARHSGWRAWGGFYQPGTVRIDQIMRIETQVWSLAGEGTMVWAGSSEKVNPRDVARVANSLSDATVTTLQKAGVLPGG
jgi:hypothetical protein